MTEDLSPCPTQAHVSCAPLRGARVDSSRLADHCDINLGSSQPDSPKHQGEDRSLDGAGAPVLLAA